MTALLTADEGLTLGVNVIVRPGDRDKHFVDLHEHTTGWTYVAPQDWLALTGQGVVPLYRACQRDLEAHPPDQDGRCIYDCPEHDDDDCVLVGRGSIEVVPVVACSLGNEPCIEASGDFAYYWRDGANMALPLDPLPTPGSDFGIVIDVTELA